MSEIKNSKTEQLRLKKANDCNVNIVFWIKKSHNKSLAEDERDDLICISSEKSIIANKYPKPWLSNQKP